MYRKYAPVDTRLEKLEVEVKEAKKGLWADPGPIPPWVYHQAKRGQSLDLFGVVPLEGDTEGRVASRDPLQLGAARPDSSLKTSSSP